MKRNVLETLNEFMNMSVLSTDEVFNKFATDSEGKIYELDGLRFYYKPGTRKDKILLIAHADTVWDKRYDGYGLASEPVTKQPEDKSYMGEDSNYYFSNNKEIGIGADDRAGAAICWLLKDSGNSILITDCEEIGAVSSRVIMSDPTWRNIINSHRFMLQLDMNGSKEFKCYGAGSEDFKAMMEARTGYTMRPNFSYTDVAFLGKDICGANLSIGYYNEHTPDEFLNKQEWFKAYKMARTISRKKHQQFYVDPEFGFKYRPNQSKKLKTHVAVPNQPTDKDVENQQAK